MLSTAKHLQYLIDYKQIQTLRCAQDDSAEGFFRSLPMSGFGRSSLHLKRHVI